MGAIFSYTGEAAKTKEMIEEGAKRYRFKYPLQAFQRLLLESKQPWLYSCYIAW